jgi:hypothetical protein
MGQFCCSYLPGPIIRAFLSGAFLRAAVLLRPGCCCCASYQYPSFSLWRISVALIAYKQTPPPTPVPSFYVLPHILNPLRHMNMIIESRQGDLTHSSLIMMWILAACAGTYLVHEALSILTHVDHCAQYSSYLARELFSISRIVGVLRQHQPQKTIESTGPPRISPPLPQVLLRDVIRCCINSGQGNASSAISPSSPSILPRRRCGRCGWRRRGVRVVCLKMAVFASNWYPFCYYVIPPFPTTFWPTVRRNCGFDFRKCIE